MPRESSAVLDFARRQFYHLMSHKEAHKEHVTHDGCRAMHLPNIDLVGCDAEIRGDGTRQGVGDVSTVHLQCEEGDAQDREQDEVDLPLDATLFIFGPVFVRVPILVERNDLLAADATAITVLQVSLGGDHLSMGYV